MDNCSKDCSIEVSKEAVSTLMRRNLKGQPLSYALKSPDMDLYDFGFGSDISYVDPYDGERLDVCSYAIHFVCPCRFWGLNGKNILLNAGTDSTLFAKLVQPLLGETVISVEIGMRNQLIVHFASFSFEIIPFDGDEESWRFMLPVHQDEHYVASCNSIELE